MRSIMNKSGKGGAITITVVALVVLLVGWMFYLGISNKAIGGQGGTGDGAIVSTACGSDKAHSGIFYIQNNLNTSGVEYFNITGYLYENGNFVKSVTMGDGSAVSLECGKTYTLKAVSTDGAGGDSSMFVSGTNGDVKDGDFVFTAKGTGSTYVLTLAQRGVPEVRAYNQKEGEYMYDTSDANAKDYETTDGIIFSSITDNATATIMDTTNTEFHVIEYIRANAVDNKFNDRGILVLIDADKTDYQVPTTKINGNVATDLKQAGGLTQNEIDAYDSYEYIYLIPATNLVRNNGEVAIDFDIFAKENVDADANISIDYSVRGQAISTVDSSKLIVGAVKDDSSNTQVLTLHNTKFWIA